MRLSVAMAVYNGEKYLWEQLESIRTQSLPVDEAVLVDDGSTDESVALAERFIRQYGLTGWRVVRNEQNIGYCLNFFRAISLTAGDVVFLCDQDDVWLPGRVERAVRTLDLHPELLALAVGYDVLGRADGLRFVETNFDGALVPLRAETMIGCSYIRGFSVCFRRALVPLMRPMDMGLLLSHDWYINLLAALAGENALLRERLIRYRHHEDNVTLARGRGGMISGERRATALKKALAAHEWVRETGAGLVNATPAFWAAMDKHIVFLRRRARFADDKNLLLWLRLGLQMGEYVRLYKSFFGGVKVWLGDLLYALRG